MQGLIRSNIYWKGGQGRAGEGRAAEERPGKGRDGQGREGQVRGSIRSHKKNEKSASMQPTNLLDPVEKNPPLTSIS